MKTQSSGYTLVEIIVAIACVFVFSLMLVSSHELNQSSAKSTQCLNNLKQINVGLHLYAVENDGSMPQLQVGWPGTQREVVSYWPAKLNASGAIPDVKLFDCPALTPKSSPYLRLGRNSEPADADWTTIEYGINSIHLATSMRPREKAGDLDVSMKGLQTAALFDQIRTPSKTISFADAVNSFHLAETGIELGYFSVSDTYIPRSRSGQAQARHGGNLVNFAWLDGHAESKSVPDGANPYSPDVLTDGLNAFHDNYWDRY